MRNRVDLMIVRQNAHKICMRVEPFHVIDFAVPETHHVIIRINNDNPRLFSAHRGYGYFSLIEARGQYRRPVGGTRLVHARGCRDQIAAEWIGPFHLGGDDCREYVDGSGDETGHGSVRSGICAEDGCELIDESRGATAY